MSAAVKATESDDLRNEGVGERMQSGEHRVIAAKGFASHYWHIRPVGKAGERCRPPALTARAHQMQVLTADRELPTARARTKPPPPFCLDARSSSRLRRLDGPKYLGVAWPGGASMGDGQVQPVFVSAQSVSRLGRSCRAGSPGAGAASGTIRRRGR